MEKVIIIVFLVLLFHCNSYSQQEESKIKMLPVSENYDLKDSCEIIGFRYPFFVLYRCSREKNVIYSSFVQDTLTAALEIKIRLHFAETSTYFTIEKIDKLTTEVLLYEKEKEKEYINEIIFQIMQNRKFYYEGQEDELEGKSFYIIMPLKFIPQKE